MVIITDRGMKCKDCNVVGCSYRTTNAEQECCYSNQSPYITHDKADINIMLSPKALWISETACKLIAQIPYEYVGSGIGGQTMEARHLYAARIAKEMADVIFGES